MDFRSEMLAARVRRHRLQNKKSIEQLAKAANVDKNTVVRIERGEGRPNLSTLLSICGALGVSADTLMAMETEESQDYFLYRRSPDSNEIENEPGLKVRDLKARLPWGRMNTVLLELTGEGKMRSHPGEEFVFCLKGTVGIMIGSTPILLNKGDSLLFFGREPHRYFNGNESDGSETSLALCVWLDEGVDPETDYFKSYHI